MMNCLKMNVMCHVRNGMDWEIYDTLWELFTYLVQGYLSSWNGWMDLLEQETNNRRNDF